MQDISFFAVESQYILRHITVGKVRDGNGPNWGLAQLMRPAKAAPAVPFAKLPLCQRPNVCISNRRGILARWYHYKSSVPDLDDHIFRLGTVAVKS